MGEGAVRCSSAPRIELIWPGKTGDDPWPGEAPALRVAERFGGEGVGWRDRLVLGDNLAALAALARGAMRAEIAAAGGVRLVYLDPPFATGRTFAAEVRIAGRAVAVPAYADHGPADLPAYLSALQARLRLVRELLAEDGSLFLHCDQRLAAHLRLVADEVFGPGRLVNEIVWRYGLGNARGRRAFLRKHDTILFYAKSDCYRFHALRGAVTPAMLAKYRHQDEQGRFMRAGGKVYRLRGGKPLESVWDDIPALAATARERLGYPTQKPAALLERIIGAATDPGDLVLDAYGGAGTTAAAAARLGRRWLAIDASPLAVHVARRRLLTLGARFEVLTIDGQAPAAPPIPYGGAPVVVPDPSGPAGVALAGYEVAWHGALAEAIAAGLRRGGATLLVEAGQLVRLRRDRAGVIAREPLTRDWRDWVEWWAVGTTAPDGVFAPAWTSLSGPLGDGPKDGAVAVRVYDVLGQAADA